MEKADKALALATDNAARIESTARLLRTHIRDSVDVFSGMVSSSSTSFGYMRSAGAAVVTFSGDAATLKLNGVPIASGTSPIIARFDRHGELELYPARNGARLLVLFR